MTPAIGQQTIEEIREAALSAITQLAGRIDVLAQSLADLRDARDEERSKVQREREERDILHSVEIGTNDITAAPGTEILREIEHQLTEEHLRAGSLIRQLTDFSSVLNLAERQLDTNSALPDLDAATELQVKSSEIRVREEERRRFARDIHDGPAQAFANAIIGLEFVERAIRVSGADNAIGEIERIKGTLREGLTEIRRFMFDLRPTMLQDRGLVPTIQHYVATYQSIFPMMVELTLDEDLPRLSDEQELTAFRMIQEAIQNASKHARADRVEVAIVHAEDGGTTVAVHDNGRGFIPDRVTAHALGGTGLRGMRERADLTGAILSIFSEPGEGSLITLHFPPPADSSLLDNQGP
jgi:two-component system sensor histidine kinase DegS